MTVGCSIYHANVSSGIYADEICLHAKVLGFLVNDVDILKKQQHETFFFKLRNAESGVK